MENSSTRLHINDVVKYVLLVGANLKNILQNICETDMLSGVKIKSA